MGSKADAEATGRKFLARFLDGAFAEADAFLTEEGRDAVVESFPDDFQDGPMDSAEALEEYWWGLYGQYGESTGIREVSATDDAVSVVCEFRDGTELANVRVDDGVTDLSFAPEYEVPEYVDETSFSERNVTVDAGDVNLNGVLTVPDGIGPLSAVLLVHGAGIHDPDGTVGATKILKDLAWGLASQGIVTLRYEKRLAEYDVEDENYTLDTVVVNDAVAAAETLESVEEVAEDAVFVAGHSQGGMCAPRIASHHGDLAGVVVLDALADSTHDPDDLAFLRYEFEPDGDLTEEQEAEIERERETFRRLAEGDFDDDEMIWDRPGTWHHSVRNYDPASTANSLDAPVFVLKTGRADDERQPELARWFRDEFEKWQAVDLAHGSRVEFYDDLDHYFQEGFAPTNPLSLYFGGNVAGSLVTDLVTWIDDVAPASNTS